MIIFLFKTIEAYFSTIIKKISNQKILLMSSNAITNILIQKKFDYYAKINLFDYDSMVGAVLVNESHWNLFYVSIKNKTFTLIDPMEASKSFLLKTFTNWR